MIKKAADLLIYGLLGLPQENVWSNVAHFFVYDTVKIMLLLFVMISVIGFIRSFISEEKLKQTLSKHGLKARFAAAAFGALTPFCSCSSIPLFLSFVKMGIPLGVMFSFLVTAPVLNEYLIVIMAGTFGWKIALAYFISGITIGVTAGTVLGSMKLEHLLEQDITLCTKKQKDFKGILSRVMFGIDEAVSIVKKIWIWILAAVALGAFIHNFVPQQLIQDSIAKTGAFSVPLAVFLGVPMYGSCAAIVPIALVLFEKGLPLGTALAFMMAVSALSLPEFMILRRAMKPKLLMTFIAITTAGIIITGYLFNYLQPLL